MRQSPARKVSADRSDGPFHVTGFDHVTLEGTDTAATVEFYRDVLGMSLVLAQPNLDRRHLTHLFFDPGDGRLVSFFVSDEREVREGEIDPDPGEVHHLAFHVDVGEADAGRDVRTRRADGWARRGGTGGGRRPGNGRVSRWTRIRIVRSCSSENNSGNFNARGVLRADMEEDTASDVYYRRLDTDREAPAEEISEVVAELEDTPNEELTPVWVVIDDVLQNLFSDPPSSDAEVQVAFSYEGYRIVVDQDGSATFTELS